MADERVSGKNSGQRSSVFGVTLDIAVIFGVIVMTAVMWHAQPLAQRGFLCSDESIRYPYYEEDTIPLYVLLCTALGIPIICMIVVDLHLYMTARKCEIGSNRRRSRFWNTCLIPKIGSFIFGAAFTTLVTISAKCATGRLRPNFLAACRPWIWFRCTDEYMTKVECQEDDPYRLREATLSFPSLHASLSSFCFVYFAVHFFHRTSPRHNMELQRLHKMQSTHASLFVRPLIILVALAIPFFISCTRVSDFKSHPTDVLAGIILGVGVAGVLIYIMRCDFVVSSPVDTSGLLNTEQPLVTKPRIGVCTSAVQKNVAGLLSELRSRFDEHVVEEFVFVQLPYSGLDKFNLEKVIAQHRLNFLMLCHSIQNRRLSLTNVMDALYDQFIPLASRTVGKDKFVVIAHDFDWLPRNTASNSRINQMDTLKSRQPTVFEYAGLVLVAGNLSADSSVGLLDKDWVQISKFLDGSCRSSESHID